MSPQSLVLVSDGPVFRHAGRLYSRDTYLRFVPYLARNFREVRLVLPIVTAPPPAGFPEIELDGPASRNIIVAASYPVQSIRQYYARLPWLLWRNVRLFADLFPAADVVLLRAHALTALLAAMVARVCGKRTYLSIVGDERQIVATSAKYPGWRGTAAAVVATLHEQFVKAALHLADGAFFLSSALMQRYAGYSRNSHFTFTNLVDDADIVVRENRRQAGDRLALLAVGRFVPEKGFDLLLRAMAQLRDAGVDCQLTLCGDGPDREALHTLAETLQLATVVQFAGFVGAQTDLDRKYLLSDVYVLPSLSEGVPKTLPEAMAKGAAIVATDVGGTPDIITPDQNGLLVESGSVDALVRGIRRLAHDPQLQARVVDGGYRFVRAHTASIQAARIARILAGEALAGEALAGDASWADPSAAESAPPRRAA